MIKKKREASQFLQRILQLTGKIIELILLIHQGMLILVARLKESYLWLIQYCLLVDAVDGPMPQTRFVTQKAFELGLQPILVINKVDRPEARPHWVLDQVFELFDNLGATDEQLDFTVIYASAINGLQGMSQMS